ncbi:MAG: hypothetical protein ACE5F3_03065 [Mariprofundaceae bacterium]
MALALIAALVSVSSIPLLPGVSVCAYAAERVADDCDTCHADTQMHDMQMHDMHMDMAHEMGSSAMMPHHTTEKHAAEHSSDKAEAAQDHHAKLSPKAQSCRIECGCGCHHSADGFPNAFSPHVFSDHGLGLLTVVIHVAVPAPAVPAYMSGRVPLPPPELS